MLNLQKRPVKRLSEGKRDKPKYLNLSDIAKSKALNNKDLYIYDLIEEEVLET